MQSLHIPSAGDKIAYAIQHLHGVASIEQGGWHKVLSDVHRPHGVYCACVQAGSCSGRHEG